MLHLLFVRNKVIVLRVIEVMIDVDEIGPGRIRIFFWCIIILGNLLCFMFFIKLCNRQSLPSKFVAEPNVVSDDVIKYINTLANDEVLLHLNMSVRHSLMNKNQDRETHIRLAPDCAPAGMSRTIKAAA